MVMKNRDFSKNIRGLNCSKERLCNVINNEFVPVPEQAEPESVLFKAQSTTLSALPLAVATITANTTTSEGKAYTAEAEALDMEGIPIELALLGNGTQIANLDFSGADFTLDKLFDITKFDNIDLFVFKDVSVTLKTAADSDKGVSEGQEKENVIIFSGNLDMEKEPLSVFRSFLGTDTKIFLQGEIGLNTIDLTKKIKPTFAVFKTGATMFVPIMDGIVLKSAMLELIIKESYHIENMEEHWDMDITPSVIGELEISCLSAEPLALYCSGSYDSGTISLNASCNEITDFLYVSGLKINYLNVKTQIGKQNELKLYAGLTAGSTEYLFGGIINSTGAGVYVEVGDFTLNDLDDLFNNITSANLTLPDFDIAFKDTFVGIATYDCVINGVALKKGLTLKCEIGVHDFTCGAYVMISPEGISISGALGNLDIGPLHIEEALLSIDIFSGKSSSFSISGKVTVQGVKLECRVAYEKTDNGWNTVVYAGIVAERFSLGSVFPEVKGTFVDTLAFSKLGFIYSAKNTKTQDEDYQFEVKQGLQLMGVLEEIPALSVLTGNNNIGLIFSAHLGSTTDISIQMPDTKLSMGASVTCTPFTINIVLSPLPALQLIFGMDLSIPNQDTPLHFDIALDIDTIGAKASATMNNWWEDPFGINGLRIGPAVALQIGIIYAQFVETGLPSEFGIAGGLAMGDVIINMAVNISEDPSKEILMGSLSKLEMSDLVSFTETMTGIDIPASLVPDFLEIRDLELYCAPSGGTIGTITFEPGFSFSGVLTLFDKTASVYARFSDSGFAAKGSIDSLDLGILKITGCNGENATLDLELTKEKQSVYIDGAFEILGMKTAVNVDISKEHINFMFVKNFLGLLDFTVKGKSKGSLSDLNSLDFLLYSEFNNNITDYIKDNLLGKIDIAINAVNVGIDEAKAALDTAEKAYSALYTPALNTLTNAQNAAKKYLDECIRNVENEREKYSAALDKAKKDVVNTKNAFDNAVKNAEDAVTKAENDYTSSMKSAESAVSLAQKDYDNALQSAINDVNRAESNYNNALNVAKSKLKSAQNSVNSLLSEINDAVYKLKHLKWYEYSYKAPYYSGKIATLTVAVKTAKGVLYTCEKAVDVVKYGSEYIAFEAAKKTLELVRYGGKYTVLEAAKRTLEGVRYGVQYSAFQSSKIALQAVKTGAEYTVWQAALKTLDAVQSTGDLMLKAAEAALNNIASSAIYIALEAAKQSLEIIKHSTEFVAFEAAKAVLEGAKQGASAILKLSEYILKHAGDIIDIKQITLAASLKEIQKGELFTASIRIFILGKEYNWTFTFDISDIVEFIESLFVKVFEEVKDLALSI